VSAGRFQFIVADNTLFLLLTVPAEHVGSKSAVQIRSHAQKFFDKVEKGKDGGAAAEVEEEGVWAHGPEMNTWSL
jgi:hypothetical protein